MKSIETSFIILLLQVCHHSGTFLKKLRKVFASPQIGYFQIPRARSKVYRNNEKKKKVHCFNFKKEKIRTQKT